MPAAAVTVRAFQSLVEEFVTGFPPKGSPMLTDDNLRFVAAQLLLHEHKGRCSATANLLRLAGRRVRGLLHAHRPRCGLRGPFDTSQV